MSLELGSLVDKKYLIVRLIGEGGMGAVFEGQNVLIQRRVAIKVLHRATAANEATVTRFEREAQAAGRIGSDHILEVIDLGTLPDGDRYIVMEYLDGEPLSARIQRLGRLTPTELRPLLRQTLVGLSAAHQAGIIHRDLKPDNIYVLTQKAGHKDFVKIIDFGISKFSAVGSNMAMTTAGALMGTPFYMSPEQAKGSPIDARSDLYAMGVIAYEALAGRVPFSGETFNELMFKIALSAPTPLVEENPEIDPHFAAIVDKMMARNVEDRYASADEVIRALDAWTASAPSPLIGGATTTSTPHGPREAPVTSVLEEPSGAPRTGASWSNTQADAVPKKSTLPVIAIGVAGAVLLAGVAFAVVKLTGSTESESSPAPQQQASENSAKAEHEAPVVAPGTSAGKSAGDAPSAESSAKTSGTPEVTPLSAPSASASAKAAIKPQVKKGTRKEKLGSHEFGY
jgi:serine/threonine-protein kinase